MTAPTQQGPDVPEAAITAAIKAWARFQTGADPRPIREVFAEVLADALPAIQAQERGRLLRRLRDLAPHEIACACGKGGTFEASGHDEDCPRREVDEMLTALDQEAEVDSHLGVHDDELRAAVNGLSNNTNGLAAISDTEEEAGHDSLSYPLGSAPVVLDDGSEQGGGERG